MKTFPLEKYGTTRPIQLQVASYMNGNLAIEMITWEDGCPEPWNTLTVNLTWPCEKDCAFIDTNNNGKEILILLLQQAWSLEAVSAHIRNTAFRKPFCGK